MKTKVFSLLCAFLLIAARPAIGATSEVVHTLDIQRVIAESIAGKAARNDLETEVKKRQGKFEKQKAELKVLQTELEKQAAVLSAAALESRVGDVRRKERDLVRAIKDEQQEIELKHDAAVSRIVKDIDLILAELSKERGMELVVERDNRFVVYANEAYDITDEVLERLDDRKVGG